MYFPVRCFTCGKVIAHLYEKYVEEVKSGKDIAEVLTSMGVERYCCRRMFISHVDITAKLVKYKKL